MADDKGWKFVEKIQNHQFMDVQDQLYFAMYSSAMDNQADILAEQYNIDPKEAEEAFDFLMDSLLYNKKEYIVNGAPLKCSMQADENNEQTFLCQGKLITSKAVQIEDMSALQLSEERKESANGIVFANISDTRGGLRGELLKKDDKLNITSFGNCRCFDGDNIRKIDDIAKNVYQSLKQDSEYSCLTEEEVLKGILKAIQLNKGTCYCCMALNSEWENLPAEYDYVDNSFERKLPVAGIDAVMGSKSYLQFEGKEGINMMSMLFCKYGGGIISAKQSGQHIITVAGNLDKEQIIFVATIYGEAGGCSETAWQVIANVIMNRRNDKHWGEYSSITEIIEHSGFDAYTNENNMYKIAKSYLDNRDYTNAEIEKMISLVIPIYEGETTDISNGATMYYSPGAQKELHEKYPEKYKEKPNWNFNLLEEINISGIENDDFLFYKYK